MVCVTGEWEGNGEESEIERWEWGGCEIKQVLYADDTALVTETREHLQHIVSEFERACDIMGLKINVGKKKVLTIKKDQMGSCEKVWVRGGGGIARSGQV